MCGNGCVAVVIPRGGILKAHFYVAGRVGAVSGISEGHFRRLRDHYEADGAEGSIDRRRGRISGQ